MTQQGDTQLVLAAIRRDDPRSMSAIAEDLGISRRRVEKAVQSLRLAGQPIASNGAGVFYATSWKDLADTFQSLRHRVVEQSRTAWQVRRSMRRLRAIEEVGEQECLFWPEVAA